MEIEYSFVSKDGDKVSVVLRTNSYRHLTMQRVPLFPSIHLSRHSIRWLILTFYSSDDS